MYKCSCCCSCSTALQYVLAVYLAVLGTCLMLLLLQQCLLISLNVTGVEVARLRALVRKAHARATGAGSGDEADSHTHSHATTNGAMNGGSSLKHVNGFVDSGAAMLHSNGIGNGVSHSPVERQPAPMSGPPLAPSTSAVGRFRSALSRLPCGCLVEAFLCLLIGAFAWLAAPAALWSAHYRSPFSQGVVRNWYLFARAQRNLDSLAALALLNGNGRGPNSTSRKAPHLLPS